MASGEGGMGLRLQFSLWIGFLLSLVLGLLAYTVYRHEKSVLTDSLEARGSSLTQMFARFLVDPVLKQDFVQIQQLIMEGREHRLYQHATLIDAEGNILAHTTPTFQGRKLADTPFVERIGAPAGSLKDAAGRDRSVAAYVAAIRDADRRSEVLIQKFAEDTRRWMEFSTAVALEHGKDVNAFLRVGLEMGPAIDAVVRETQRRLLKLFLPAILLGILLSTFLARYIAGPIRLVVASVRRIAAGDYGRRAWVDGPRELTVLAESVNQMGSEIRQRITEIDDARKELDRKYFEIKVLFEVSKAMNFKSYSPELLTYLLDMILDALNSSWASIMMLDEEADKLRTQHVRGGSWDPALAPQIAIGEGIAGRVFARGEPIVCNLGHLDPQFASLPGQSKEFEQSIRQLICVPLLVENKPIGVINVVNKKDGSEYNDSDLRLLVALASQAARSLENARLYSETIRESKTGLFVPSYFSARVGDEIANARRFKEEFSLLMIDIDFFKQVNDNYGHMVGDELLIKVAHFILDTARDSVDVACRFGGEEFAILLPRTDRAGAITYAERLRRLTESSTADADRNLPAVTISVGIATYPADGQHYASLIEQADRRLYQSKETGRNCVTA
ncbi:MAG: diguanylate cyclase [Candidatus Wallbacteria bacterium]|nr:diguanylate cyclase [Candidatus Wallbacteria bacterium]